MHSVLALKLGVTTPSAESADDSSAGPGARYPRTRAGKRKAAATPPPQKKPRKVSGIKINDPAPNPSPGPTPPTSTRGRFTMRRSNR
jgi:hypothetical protein